MAPAGKDNPQLQDRVAAAAAVGLGPNSNWAEINAKREALKAEAEYAKLMGTATDEQKTLASETPAQEAERIRQEQAKIEDQRAKAMMEQSFAQARAELERQNQAQIIDDQLAAEEAAATGASAGAAATAAGGGKAVPDEKKGVKGLPSEAAPNIPTNIPPPGMMPANTGVGNSPGRANTFALPNTEGLRFGGG